MMALLLVAAGPLAAFVPASSPASIESIQSFAVGLVKGHAHCYAI